MVGGAGLQAGQFGADRVGAGGGHRVGGAGGLRGFFEAGQDELALDDVFEAAVGVEGGVGVGGAFDAAGDFGGGVGDFGGVVGGEHRRRGDRQGGDEGVGRGGVGDRGAVEDDQADVVAGGGAEELGRVAFFVGDGGFDGVGAGVGREGPEGAGVAAPGEVVERGFRPPGALFVAGVDGAFDFDRGEAGGERLDAGGLGGGGEGGARRCRREGEQRAGPRREGGGRPSPPAKGYVVWRAWLAPPVVLGVLECFWSASSASSCSRWRSAV